jgi:secondary thiamine-phosphate synthase enzyme
MMSEIKEILMKTNGEGFYSLTPSIKNLLKNHWPHGNGVLTLFNTHTSCGLTINEAYAPEAALDLEAFLKHIAPRNLAFIKHKDEGPDDSPSHMKSLLIQTSLQIFVEHGELKMGQWQGIYLCEFRDEPKTRKILARLSS